LTNSPNATVQDNVAQQILVNGSFDHSDNYHLSYTDPSDPNYAYDHAGGISLGGNATLQDLQFTSGALDGSVGSPSFSWSGSATSTGSGASIAPPTTFFAPTTFANAPAFAADDAADNGPQNSGSSSEAVATSGFQTSEASGIGSGNSEAASEQGAEAATGFSFGPSVAEQSVASDTFEQSVVFGQDDTGADVGEAITRASQSGTSSSGDAAISSGRIVQSVLQSMISDNEAAPSSQSAVASTISLEDVVPITETFDDTPPTSADTEDEDLIVAA
jgi:hypothetical protein